MKVLFLGTPAFAAASLAALLSSSHEVVGVVTQPDRALKRGKTEAGAVKLLALERGLTVVQPQKIRDEIELIKSFGADIGVTAAYGQILTQAVIDAFPHGIINVHASLLPEYRGASPIQSAIADGRKETGVTIMRTERGIDTGDILSFVKTEIGENETAGELTERLAALGAKLLIETLDNFGGIVPVKQDETKATHCKTIKKEELAVDFSRPAEEVVNHIRALSPSPCARTEICGEMYKIYSAVACEPVDGEHSIGEVFCTSDGLYIACGVGAVSVTVIQAPSKRALPIKEFLRGRKFPAGVICGSQKQ